jgi:hypothetical protein
MELSNPFHIAMSFKDFFTIKNPQLFEPQVSMNKKVKVPMKKVLVFEYFDSSTNEEHVDSLYVSSPENEHMDAHNALEPENKKDIWEEKEQDSIDTILF